MLAEARLRNYGTLSHLATLWASLNLILYSIFSDVLETYIPIFDKFIVCLSIIVFSLSIGNYVFRFFERAQSYRDCYLRLQKLFDCELPRKELAELYHNILSQFANHADRDYDDLIVRTVSLKKQTVLSSEGKPIIPTRFTTFMFFVRHTTYYVFYICVFLLPLAPYLIAVAHKE